MSSMDTDRPTRQLEIGNLIRLYAWGTSHLKLPITNALSVTSGSKKGSRLHAICMLRDAGSMLRDVGRFLRNLEKMLQTVESFGTGFRVFGFEIWVFGTRHWVFGTTC